MVQDIEIRDRARLLKHLGSPTSYGISSPLGCGRIALYRMENGASLGAGYVVPAAAAALVSEGVAVWRTEGRRARLVLKEDAVPRASPAVAAASTAPPQPVVPRRDERESPLLWLHRRPGKDGKPQIGDQEFAAGERFRADLTRARILPRTTMNWDAALTPDERGPGARDPAGASDAAVAARQRVRRACERLGPELSGVAIDVCGFLKGLDLVERERQWPARSAKVVLRLALATLASHYGIDRVRGRADIAGWQAPGARPGIPPSPER
ncbi:MAG: DUF6456 domain-containing protein [Bosea sp. (in: a-proteobacteria)]|uniref:DUF6456 domain-containing protein n=1 Tax=Bosea sp. (in: a-proteobacteria) TaxID=1871050 RepID=UPI003F7B7059